MIYNIHSIIKSGGGTTDDGEETLKYLKALKFIIGSDGEIAGAEWDALKDWMERMNVPASIAEEITHFDISGTSLEKILPNLKKGSRRVRWLIHDAISISQADGVFSKEESDAVFEMADLLGVQAAVVEALQALVDMESATRRLRQALLE